MPKFRIPQQAQPKPDSPNALFFDLKRDSSIKFLGDHQGKLLEEYQSKHLNERNLAIELPTGAGKTLVGLLTAEFRRRRDEWRGVFLCPTRQLCGQVHMHSHKYGIPTVLLVGPQADYDPNKFFQYQQAKAIAITTYSGLFTERPPAKAGGFTHD